MEAESFADSSPPIHHSTPIPQDFILVMDRATQTNEIKTAEIACQATNTARDIRECVFDIEKMLADDLQDPSCKPLKHSSQPRSCIDFCCDSNIGAILIGTSVCVFLIILAFWYDYNSFLKSTKN